MFSDLGTGFNRDYYTNGNPGTDCSHVKQAF